MCCSWKMVDPFGLRGRRRTKRTGSSLRWRSTVFLVRYNWQPHVDNTRSAGILRGLFGSEAGSSSPNNISSNDFLPRFFTILVLSIRKEVDSGVFGVGGKWWTLFKLFDHVWLSRNPYALLFQTLIPNSSDHSRRPFQFYLRRNRTSMGRWARIGQCSC